MRFHSLAKTARFIELLAQLLDGSIPLITCLESIECFDVERALKMMASTLKKRLLAGDALADFFWGKSGWQRAVFVLIRAGERGGFLALSLHRAADLLRARQKWQEQLRVQLTYPALLLLSSALLLSLYYLLIYPLFQDLLLEKARVVEVSDSSWPIASKLWLFWPFAGLMLCSMLLLKSMRTATGALSRPGKFRPRFWRERDLATLFDLLAKLFEDQTAFDSTWELMPQLVLDEELSAKLAYSVERMVAGHLPSDALMGLKELGELELQLLRIGEKTGQMSKAAERICSYLKERSDRRLKLFLAILQPALLLLAGLMIARIALLVLRPMERIGSFDLW